LAAFQDWRYHSVSVHRLRLIFTPGTSVFVGWSNDCHGMPPLLPSRTTRLYVCA
jgi:hypothetical protein